MVGNTKTDRKQSLNEDLMGTSFLEESSQQDAQHWNKYFEKLKEKITIQREKIKNHDKRMAERREKAYQQELEIRMLQKFRKNHQIQTHRNFALKAPSKIVRLY